VRYEPEILLYRGHHTHSSFVGPARPDNLKAGEQGVDQLRRKLPERHGRGLRSGRSIGKGASGAQRGSPIPARQAWATSSRRANHVPTREAA
jgi:hypothetical protein